MGMTEYTKWWLKHPEHVTPREKITWEGVLALRNAIPPRQPRGDPKNKARIGPVRRFNAAFKQYELEHGKRWRAKWNGECYVPA